MKLAIEITSCSTEISFTFSFDCSDGSFQSLDLHGDKGVLYWRWHEVLVVVIKSVRASVMCGRARCLRVPNCSVKRRTSIPLTMALELDLFSVIVLYFLAAFFFVLVVASGFVAGKKTYRPTKFKKPFSCKANDDETPSTSFSLKTYLKTFFATATTSTETEEKKTESMLSKEENEKTFVIKIKPASNSANENRSTKSI